MRLLPLLFALACTQPARSEAPVQVAASPSPSRAARAPVLEVPRPAGGEWLGIYLMGNKAGFTFQDVAEIVWEGRPAVRSTSKVTLDVKVEGKSARRSMDEERIYAPGPGGRLIAFRQARRGDGGDEDREGRCDERVCRIKIVTSGGEETIEIPAPPETSDAADPARLVLGGRDAVTVSYLDLSTLRVKESVTKRLSRDGGVARTSTIEKGEALETVGEYALPSGAVRSITMGPAMTAKAEPREAAVAGIGAADVFGLTKVRLPGAVPVGSKELTLTVKGLPDAFLTPDPRQSYEKLAGGAVRVTIRAAAPEAAPAPDLAPHLEATPELDHKHPAVAALAKKLLPAPKDPRADAETLLKHVYGSLRKTYAASSDRASRVLAEGKGDCTEHAVLFVALARAAGIPARTVHGLVVSGDDAGRAMLWHEWAEIWAGRWIAMDPIFGQTVADAGHLALGRGEQTSAAMLLGQLEVVDVQVR